MHRVLPILILLLLVAIPSFGQSGLISGVVVSVTDEDENPVSDLPVIVDGEDQGGTDDDGEIIIGIGSFDDDSDVVIRVKYGDDPAIYVDEDGENNCDDEEEMEGDDDDDCLLAGYIRGWKPGRFHLVFGDDPTLTEDPGDDGMGDDDGNGGGFGHAEPSYRFHVLLGRNFEFEFNTITVRAQVPIPVGVPLTLDPAIEYMPGDDFRSVIVPSLDANCNFTVGDMLAEIFFGGGIRGYKQKFDFEGVNNPDIEWGFGLRAGALYPVGPVEAIAELDLTRVYSTMVPTFRLGASYKLKR